MAALVAVSLALAFNLLRLGVVVLLLSVAVAATRVPGLKWDALEVWEASALPGAWDDVDGYLDFRTYALDRLSDLGFLDILLDDLRASTAPVLRVIADCGDYTGMAVLLVGAAAAASSSSGRSSRPNHYKS